MKRRKLEHTDSEDESEASFAGFDDVDGAQSDGSAEADGVDGSNDPMNGFEDLDEEDMGLEEDHEESEKEDGGKGEDRTVSTLATKATNAQKPPKRSAPSLQDGAYTSESFRSNIFKLQVEELLEQVKLSYGRKEAPAENAMRTLKSIIEQIPNRDALPVCTYFPFSQPHADSCRSLKLRRRSRLPE
jgi:U3 small nucleolar RNA-associated protein 22